MKRDYNEIMPKITLAKSGTGIFETSKINQKRIPLKKLNFIKFKPIQAFFMFIFQIWETNIKQL